MAVRITQAGGRTRRKGGAVSLAGGDVPIVQPARDPGLNVPLIPTPVDPTLGLLGTGLEEVSEVFNEFADVAEKIQTRKATVDLADRMNKFNEEVAERLRDITAEQDMSDEAVLNEFGGFMLELKRKSLEEHRAIGTAESNARLTVRLGNIESRVRMEAATISTVVGRQKVDQILDTDLASLITFVQRDPGNLGDAIGRGQARIDSLAPALPEDEELLLRKFFTSTLTQVAIERVAASDDIEGAEELLRSATRLGQIDADTALALTTSLTDARLSRNEALFNIAQAEVALGRDLTPDEILRAFDLAPGTPLVQLNLPSQPEPGTRFVNDPETGEIIGVEPLPGSKAEREAAKAAQKAVEQEAAEESARLTEIVNTGLFKRDFATVIKLVEDTSDFGRAFLSRVPFTKATAARNILQTIKDRFTLENLIEIKKAGGTLGALNETEFRALGSRFGALDFDMPKEQLLPILIDARDIIAAENIGGIDRIREIIKDIISREPEGELPEPLGFRTPTKGDINKLKANPNLERFFDKNFGPGAAAKVLKETKKEKKEKKSGAAGRKERRRIKQ